MSAESSKSANFSFLEGGGSKVALVPRAKWHFLALIFRTQSAQGASQESLLGVFTCNAIRWFKCKI